MNDTSPSPLVETGFLTDEFSVCGMKTTVSPCSVSVVLIRVIRNTSDSDMHPDDLDVASVYRVELNESVKKDFADVALDVFHSNVAIERLDDFFFEVYDVNGNALPTSDTYESYSQANAGIIEIHTQ
ncbi:hypothetical protein LMH73_010270 [Vibrio splendidus]|nr:hypothetical protein [Vibrio splendidus]MCC4883323.1 hypothetical protein [Vibrio splendidus]